jgi:hypothetical protein
LRKISLEFWFKKNTLEFINAESNKGKTIGTQIHDAIEHYILTGEAKIETEYAQEVTNALKSFMLFRKERPEINLKWSEMELTSEKYQYNGTIDCISDGLILDWKTGKAEEKDAPAIYDEYKYQVSAYVHLYNEVNNANIDKAIIVSVAKDKIAYGLYEMGAEEIKDCFNEVFLPALKILTYQKGKNFYGKPTSSNC